MSSAASREMSTTKPGKTKKSRFWKFQSTRSSRTYQETNPDASVHEEPRSISEADGKSDATVERSQKSVPNSQQSISFPGSSFSSKRGKSQAFTEEGYPPNGYLWIWTGVLRRWNRNYFLLETPGVLTQCRRPGSQTTGAFCLRDARVVPSRGNSTQFCIVSPVGVAYLRSMRKDQRGPWIAAIRASIEKYTQCVLQAERVAQSGGLEFTIETEESILAKEVENRLRQRMSELLPHQAALRWHMNQLTRKINSVKEILGSAQEAQPQPPRRRSLNIEPSTRTVQNQRITGRNSMHAFHTSHPSRRPSLTDSLSNQNKASTPTRRPKPSKTSADDMTLRSGSSMDVQGLREKAKLRKCQTPRPVESNRWNASTPPPGNPVKSEIQRGSPPLSSRRSLDIPTTLPAANRAEAASFNDSGVWKSYQAFVEAVQRLIQKEVQNAMELEVENVALKRLLEGRRSDGTLSSMARAVSASTSRSFSTAASEFDASLLENSDDEDPNVVKRVKATELSPPPPEDLMSALEVVHRAEYVTRDSSKNEALILNLQNTLPPKDFCSDYEDDSQLEAQVLLIKHPVLILA